MALEAVRQGTGRWAGPLGPRLAADRPTPGASRRLGPGRGFGFLRDSADGPARPGDLAGCGGGRRPDRGRHPGPQEDRDLWRLRRRRRLRHEHPLGLPEAGRGSQDVEYYIPHRVEEGYGVNAEALRKLGRRASKAEVVITVDCGISAIHRGQAGPRPRRRADRDRSPYPGTSSCPSADGRRPPPSSPAASTRSANLCGCGVAFKLAWQICKSFGDGKKASPHLRDFLVKSIGLVAMATVADVMPIHGENRLLVRHGLAGLARLAEPRGSAP